MMKPFSFLKRRRKLMLAVFLLVLTGATAVTMTLPSMYRAQATILIKGSQNPGDLVHSAVSGFVDQRITVIKQVVLSREKLAALIEGLGLYPKERKAGASSEALVERMRGDIQVEPIEAESAGARFGASVQSTIAFTLAYEGRDPAKVAQVVNVLVSQFLEENVNSRAGKAWQTYTFLEGQLATLEAEVARAEAEIARFKEGNLHSLPQFMDVNMTALDNIQKEIEFREVQLKSARDRKVMLQGQLANLDPTVPERRSRGDQPSLEEQLEQMQADYLSLKAVQSATHPDVIRLKNQIQALGRAVEAAGTLRGLRLVLEEKERDLVLARERYAPKHPDVLKGEREVAALKERIGEMESRERAKGKKVEPEGERDNPAYINVQTQIESTSLEIAGVETDLDLLHEKYDEYMRRLEQMPQVEQQFIALQRRHASLQEKHKETYERLRAAQETINLEKEQISEKFEVIESAVVPERPFKPNRRVLFILGMLLSVALGLGAGVAAEQLDHTVHSAGQLQSVSGHSVLGVIPVLRNARDRRRMVRRRVVAALGILLCCALVAGTALYFSNRSGTWRFPVSGLMDNGGTDADVVNNRM